MKQLLVRRDEIHLLLREGINAFKYVLLKLWFPVGCRALNHDPTWSAALIHGPDNKCGCYAKHDY